MTPKEVAKELGAKRVQPRPQWKDYKCYEAVFSNDPLQVVATGLPLIILQRGDMVRAASPKETWQYMREVLFKEDDE